MDFTVSYRGSPHSLSLLPHTTLAVLQAHLEELTSVPPSHQKLLFKGKRQVTNDQDTIEHLGIRNGMKVQLLGPTRQELDEMQSVQAEREKKDRILKERAAKAPVKVRSTASPSTSASITYTFHHIEPLPHLPNPSTARSLLTKLSNDPAVRHIMQKHQFSVGVLTELAPHEHPNLLGLNVNAGQAIKLRVRTDAYDGFRTYKEVRKVLCHELTHNVWGDHDNNFKELNSLLNREVLEYERAQSLGTHHLGESDDVYMPSTELEAEARAYVLSGGSAARTQGGSSETASSGDTREEMRRRVLEATMERLKREEEELEHHCGTTH